MHSVEPTTSLLKLHSKRVLTLLSLCPERAYASAVLSLKDMDFMTTESDLQKTHAATTELNLGACGPHTQFALKTWHFVSIELAS